MADIIFRSLTARQGDRIRCGGLGFDLWAKSVGHNSVSLGIIGDEGLAWEGKSTDPRKASARERTPIFVVRDGCKVLRVEVSGIVPPTFVVGMSSVPAHLGTEKLLVAS